MSIPEPVRFLVQAVDGRALGRQYSAVAASVGWGWPAIGDRFPLGPVADGFA